MSNANNLDIWGNPIEGKHDCFLCGEYYFVSDSTASNEYRTTYCSKECEEKDTLNLKMAAEAEARFTNHRDEPQPQNITEVQVGPFKLKVRKEP